MDISKKYRWALIGLVVMILLNAATLITIWMNNPASRPGMHNLGLDHERSEMHQSMKNRLGLTDEQSQQIMEIRRSHYREMRTLRAQMDEYRQAYLDIAIAENGGNSDQRDSLLTHLTNQYMKIEEAMFSHFTEMRDILNEDQRETFKKLMRNSFMHQGGQNPERPQR